MNSSVCRTISETLSSLLPHECFSIQPEALSTLFNLTMKLDTKAAVHASDGLFVVPLQIVGNVVHFKKKIKQQKFLSPLFILLYFKYR